MKYATVLAMMVLVACSRPELTPLEHALRSSHPAMLNVLHDPQGYEVQILYTRIVEDSSGSKVFEDYEFRLNDELYFYPASTVKFPAAVLAIERADALDSIGLDTPYQCGRDSLVHTISDDVRQIFAVSDNEAYNRLYEWLGRDVMNARLREMDLGPVRLSHRLSTPNSNVAERDTLRFASNDSTVASYGPADDPIELLDLVGQKKGKGFMRDGKVVNQPMDFSEKNYFPLSTQHELTKRVIFPEMFEEDQRFQLSSQSRARLLFHMHQLPRMSGYDESEYYDSYGKFFLYGDNKDRIPDHMKIYNKVGYAYGTLSETAYIIDEQEGIEFILSATILVNKNGIFNDDNYEYDEIGIPFLAQLGRELYVYERVHKDR